MAFYDRLKEARINAELTQEQLAEKLGVAKSTLSGYESGNREPTVATISKALKTLNIDANFLYQDEVDALGGNPVKLKYDEMKHIEKYRELDDEGKETVDYILEKEYRRVIKERTMNPRQLVIDMDNPGELITMDEWMSRQQNNGVSLDAAHERTDIKVTNEMRKHDDDIMDSDDF